MKTVSRLDSEAIAVLHRLGGPLFVQQMIDSFLHAAPKRLEQARDALRSGSWLELERFALALRSSAGNIGATEVRNLARRLEEAAGHRDGAAFPSLFARTEAALARVLVSAKKLLDDEADKVRAAS
jgi:HPt (histidine-containing phosphotransfer) domain-containing protein